MAFARDSRSRCPVMPYECAGVGYAERVCEWISNPNAFFTAFGPEARAFQSRNRSERLRTMTLVAPAEKLVALKPVKVALDGTSEKVRSWEELFSTVSARLIPAHAGTFSALQAAGELAWLGCDPGAVPVAEALQSGAICPSFASLAEIVARVQWLFLMCGIRLNEVIVQVDPYTDAEWAERHAEIRRKRADEKKFMEGRRAAQKAWAEAHPEDALSADRADGGGPHRKGTAFL